MYLRLAKCRWGPLTERYISRTGYENVDKRATITDAQNNTLTVKRGVLCGLDKSHNRDYKVAYCSDPLLVIHTKGDTTHEQIKDALQVIGIWSDNLDPIQIPRTGQDGSATYVAGYKFTPDETKRFEQYKNKLKEASINPEYAFTSETDIETKIKQPQQTIDSFNTDSADEQSKIRQ